MQLLRGEGSEVPPARRGEASCSPGAGSLREGRGTRREPAWKNVFFFAIPRAPGAVYLGEVGACSSLGPAALIFCSVLLSWRCSAAGNAGGCFPWC